MLGTRTHPVQRAELALPGQRPNPPDHYDSVRVQTAPSQLRPTRLLLADDVITRGSTFVGLYLHLRDVYPDVTLHCFALVRTMSPGEVGTLVASTTGTITYQEGQLRRRP